MNPLMDTGMESLVWDCVFSFGGLHFSGMANSMTLEGEALFYFIPSFRLDMLQQIASRVQRGSVICEDKLMLARNALQSVSSFQELLGLQ